MRIMMIRLISLIFAFFLAFSATASQAGEYESVEDIQRAAESFLQSYYDNHSPQQQVEVSVNKPDTRLRLAKCDKALTPELHGQGSRNGRATVKIRCQGNNAWGIYVTATIAITTEVAVAARSLKRGQQLQEGDIRMVSRNISQLSSGFIREKDRLPGKELKRALNPGEVIRLAHITEPTVINRGDEVAIEARFGAVAVASSGVALTDGRVGQQIRVRNSDSERIIKARVTGPGRALVSP